MKLRLPLLAATLLFAPLHAQATPVSAVLYPSGALVVEEGLFRPENGRVTVKIPAGADEGSLTFSLDKGSVTGTTSRLREDLPAPEVDAALRRLRALDTETALAQARRESLAHMRRFWSAQPAPSADDTRREKEAELLTARLESLAVKDAELALVLHNLSDERKALEKRLEALGRQNESVRECELELADAGREPVRVRWSYYLNDAGWQPRYRVQAVTDAGQVLITMDAVMRQGGGSDWKGVDVTLASSEDFRRVTPPPLPDWILGDSLASSVPRAMNVLAARAPAMRADSVAAKAAAPRDSGLRWSLGKTDIPAGAQTARPVDERRFAATFFRLIRPTEDERAWFVASLEEETMPLLPLGQASFLVDGAETARGAFRLTPGERDVSFGVDPLIGVKKNDLPTQGAENEAGIKTRQWRWKTDIVNGHDKAVTARVEAPAPILRDARMRAKAKSKPAADFQEERALYEWRLEVPALKTASVVHEVTVTSPIDASSASR